MNVLADHEFLENQQGELVLLIHFISKAPPNQAVFLTSDTERTGYLRRDSESDAVHIVPGINESVIEKLRQTKSVTVIEIEGETILHTYPAIADIYNEEA